MRSCEHSLIADDKGKNCVLNGILCLPGGHDGSWDEWKIGEAFIRRGAAMLIEVERDQEGGCAVDVFLNPAGWGGEKVHRFS